MPIALEAGKNRFSYVLKSDRDKPADEQPTFIFRCLNLRRFKAAAAPLDAAPTSGPAMVDNIIDAVGPVLVDWRNMNTNDPEIAEAFGVTLADNGSPVELPFSKDNLEVILDLAELRELLEAIMRGGVTEAELKNS
jgi:hypothetical protein